MISVLHIWVSVMIIYISASRQQRNIVQQCTSQLLSSTQQLWSSSQSPSPSFAPKAQPGFFFWISIRLVSKAINFLVQIGGLKYKVYVLNSVVRGEKQSAEVMFSFCLLLTHLESYQQPKVSSGLSQSKVQLFHSGVLGLQSANVLTKGIGWSLASFGNKYQL